MNERRPLGYLDGLGTGIAVLGLVVAGWLAIQTAELDLLYRELHPDFSFSTSTALVLSPAWRIGVPLVLVAGIIAAHLWRPRYALVGIALITLGIDLFWYLAAWAPIFQVAGNIR